MKLKPHSQFRSSLVLASAVLICATSLGLSAQAQDAEDKLDKNFLESSLLLPGAPKAEDLLRFYSNDNQSFSIDAKSLSIAADGSLRYTLVSISNSGAKNVSYEGLRCKTYEKKLFAFGRADGSWSVSRRVEWDAVISAGVNKQHSTLINDYFCEGAGIAGKVEKILQRIRLNQPLKPY